MKLMFNLCLLALYVSVELIDAFQASNWSNDEVCTSQMLDAPRDQRDFDVLSVSKKIQGDKVKLSVLYRTSLDIVKTEWRSFFTLKSFPQSASSLTRSGHVTTASLLMPTDTVNTEQRVGFNAYSPPFLFRILVQIDRVGERDEAVNLNPMFALYPDGDLVYNNAADTLSVRAIPLSRTENRIVDTLYVRDPGTNKITSNNYFSRQKDRYAQCPNSLFTYDVGRRGEISGILELEQSLRHTQNSANILVAFEINRIIIIRPSNQPTTFPPDFVDIRGPLQYSGKKLPIRRYSPDITQYCQWDEDCEVVFEVYGETEAIASVRVLKSQPSSSDLELPGVQSERHVMGYKTIVRAPVRQDDTSVSSETFSCEVTTPLATVVRVNTIMTYGRYPKLLESTRLVDVNSTTYRAVCAVQSIPAARMQVLALYAPKFDMDRYSDSQRTGSTNTMEQDIPKEKVIDGQTQTIFMIECVINGFGPRPINHLLLDER